MACAMLYRRSMVVRRYEDLVVWQLTRDLERKVFAFTATQPASKDVDYCRQIRRSASSAPRNIAEGFGRFFPGDFARFVRTARGSLVETQHHLDAGRERGYMTRDEHSDMRRVANRAMGAATRFIVYLEEAAAEWKRSGLRRPKPSDPVER
jgi:four helix bundle protein